jgi:hypothetical protein
VKLAGAEDSCSCLSGVAGTHFTSYLSAGKKGQYGFSKLIPVFASFPKISFCRSDFEGLPSANTSFTCCGAKDSPDDVPENVRARQTSFCSRDPQLVLRLANELRIAVSRREAAVQYELRWQRLPSCSFLLQRVLLERSPCRLTP